MVEASSPGLSLWELPCFNLTVGFAKPEGCPGGDGERGPIS